MAGTKSYEQLLQENADFQSRLAEAEETLHAIRNGEVDALIILTAQGNKIFTLQGADQPYRLLVEEMPEGAVTISIEGTILYCNRRFAEIVGYSPDQIVSHQIDQYFVSGERERLKIFLQGAASSNSLHEEFNCQRQTHQIIPVYISTNYLPLDHIPVICLIVSDLSEQKQAEQRLIELMLEKQRIKLLADFVRNISHDLKTPLSSIITGLYLIQRIKNEEQRNKKVQDVERQVWYLTKVLEQLQEMAILDSITELSFQSGDFNNYVMAVVSDVTPLANKKQITISTALDNVGTVLCDFDRLYRALFELLQNAIRFTPIGGQIQVRTQVPNQYQLVLEVEDNGLGIPQNKLPHIFERFYKVDEARTIAGGAGLGLPMVKRIIELHHGFIEVESIPGKKTIFRITLPIVASDVKSTET